MDFTTLGIILAVVGSVISLTVLTMVLKNKGLLTDNGVHRIQIGLNAVDAITSQFPELAHKTERIFDFAKIAVEYVEQTMKDSPSEIKKENAVEAVMKALKELGVEIDENKQQLINIAIESAVYNLNKYAVQ